MSFVHNVANFTALSSHSEKGVKKKFNSVFQK